MNEFHGYLSVSNYDEGEEDWAQPAPFTGKCEECGQGTLRGTLICRDCYTENDIDEYERAHRLASIVCDAIWGGELAWAVATDEEFEKLVERATKKLYRKEKA